MNDEFCSSCGRLEKECICNSKEFCLKRDYNGENNPHWKGINTKNMTGHEKYLRYKDTMDKSAKKWRQENKEKMANLVRKYAHKNPDKIKEKAKKVYHKDKTKGLVRANTYHNNEKKRICYDCKKEKIITQFHHLSYNPNIFIELCKECHNKRHGRNYYGR